jgi:hypothetical protein
MYLLEILFDKWPELTLMQEKNEIESSKPLSLDTPVTSKIPFVSTKDEYTATVEDVYAKAF